MLRSATASTLPPRPPSPPSGPPRGTYFSRLKLTAPLPPFPAWTSMFASSMNFMRETKKPYRVDRAFLGGSLLLSRHHADRLLVGRALEVELDLAADLGVERVVLADADVVAGMDARAALADDDAARRHQLTAVALHSQALGFGIAAVARTAACFLVCHDYP